MAVVLGPLSHPALAQTPALNESAKAMVGSWEFSNADRDRRCSVTFKEERTAHGFKLEFDPGCVDSFPLVKDIVAWTYPDNDLLHLVDGKGKSLIDFSEVESGIFEAPTAGLGVLFLQNAAAAGPPPKPPEDVAGDWTIMRSGKALCTLTLTVNALEDGFALTVKPGCDSAIARLNFGSWRIDRDELMFKPARGNPWRFEEDEGGKQWSRVPDTANPYTLVRQP